MRSGYLRNGKPYDDGHTRKSWSYWFMEMVRRRHDPYAMWDRLDRKPMRGQSRSLIYVDDADHLGGDWVIQWGDRELKAYP